MKVLVVALMALFLSGDAIGQCLPKELFSEQAKAQGYSRTVVEGPDLELFMRAYNAAPPVSNHVVDLLEIYASPDIKGEKYVVMSFKGCIVTRGGVSDEELSTYLEAIRGRKT
jgi:hypothetical protein